MPNDPKSAVLQHTVVAGGGIVEGSCEPELAGPDIRHGGRMSIRKMLENLFGEAPKHGIVVSPDPIKAVERYFRDGGKEVQSIQEIQTRRMGVWKLSKEANAENLLSYFNSLEEYAPEEDSLILYHVVDVKNKKYWVVVFDPVELFDNPTILLCYEDEGNAD